MSDDKKKKSQSPKLEIEKPNLPAKEKVSVYAETVKRKDGPKKKVIKKRKIVRRGSRFLIIVFFFVASFLFSRFFIADLFKKKDFSEDLTKKCSGDYEFTPEEKELLAISDMHKKPLEQAKRLNPCDSKVHKDILAINKQFAQKDSSGTLLSVIQMDEEIKKRGKITKLAADSEPQDILKARLVKLKSYTDQFASDYSRFKIKTSFPEGALYYGLLFTEENDEKKLLNQYRCDRPDLSFANNTISYLGLFFTLNAKRGYHGRVWTLNQRYRNLIEAQLGIYEYPREPFHRYLPNGNFEMRIHEDSQVNYKGYFYQRQWISQEYRFDWDRSAWLYNSCNNNIATVSNYCALDPSFDMQYKDFFYLVKQDKIIGNIYCKKSSEELWSRIAIFSLMRVK